MLLSFMFANITKDKAKIFLIYGSKIRPLLQICKRGWFVSSILIGSKGDDCFIRSNHLYITNKTFGVCLKNKFGRTFSAKEVTAYFRNRYISESYADNRLKKYNNKCYLVLNINELAKDARDDSHTIDNLFFE